MKKKRRIDKIHTFTYAILIMVLVFIFIKTGLLDIIGSSTNIHLGKLDFSIKLRIILFLIVFYVNAFLHEGIHALTGKIFFPDAKIPLRLWDQRRMLQDMAEIRRESRIKSLQSCHF